MSYRVNTKAHTGTMPKRLFTFCLFSIIMSISLLGSAQGNNTLNGKWKLIQIKTIKTDEVLEMVTRYALFSFSDSANIVSFSVSPSCNGFWGKYIIQDSNKIKVKAIMSGTRVSCKLEEETMNAMDSGSSYRRTDSSLYIFYNNNKNAMVFIRENSVLLFHVFSLI
jgi:heat shock protein HslJ